MSGLATPVGLIGCGTISGAYLKQLKNYRMLEVVACSDLDLPRAQAQAAEYGVPRVCTVEELLADPGIEVVLNLTVPRAHAEVASAVVSAGKHVYNEKPLALSREEARRFLDQAQERGLRVGCAPDTFLGAGLQTCRKLIDDGWIGQPIGATAFRMGTGPELWHPNPQSYYQTGSGPLFDMGPYYLTALITLLGPIRRVTGAASINAPERVITSEPQVGRSFTISTPTHVAGLLEFESGVVGNFITSFDIWASELPFMEIYGSEGTLSVPDPDKLGGPVRVRRAGAAAWSEIPLAFPFTENYTRGVGLADMVTALRTGRPHRAHGKLAYHVLDTMHALLEASEQGRHIELKSGCPRPAPLPLGLLPHELDA